MTMVIIYLKLKCYPMYEKHNWKPSRYNREWGPRQDLGSNSILPLGYCLCLNDTFQGQRKGNKASSKRFLEVRCNFTFDLTLKKSFSLPSLVTIRCSPVLTASNSFNISSSFPLRLDWTTPQPFSHTHCLLARPCQHTFFSSAFLVCQSSLCVSTNEKSERLLFVLFFFFPSKELS